nr:phospholipase-like protein [Tanacetum cinerariifolium]
MQDEEERVNGIEHRNGMCGDTEVEVSEFVQDEEARVNGIEHHNRMCGDTKDGNFAERIDETICLKSNQMSVEEGDDVLDSEGDGVHLSQTNDVIQQAINLLTMSSTSPQAINPAIAEVFFQNLMLLKRKLSTEAKASSFSSNLGNDKDASHLDDLMEIDENPTLDLVVPPKDDDCILRTRKPNDAYDVVEDDYMLLLNDEEKPVKSSLNDMELEQEPDKIDVKQGILEQQPNAPKGKTTVLEETIEVKVKEKPGLGRGVGPFKVKKKKFQRALRPNYLLRSAKDRKKKLSMALKPPFGQQLATTPVPKKGKSTFMKTEVNVPPFYLEDISGQPRIRSMNDIMTHESFVENLSRPADYKSDKVYFSVNEPKTHWCLAELEIRTGVVTFYDSLGWAVMHGIIESKGISADDYKITYKYADAPFQASLFGDCGIWVCIFIYRLCRNLPLTVDDPLETALAYRKMMLEYF